VPVVGAGSAYDGGAYGSIPAASNPSVPVVGTGSAYDGGAYGSIPAAPVQPSCLGIDLPAGTDMSEITSGMRDYVRQCSYRQSAAAQPVSLGIDLPAGSQLSDLPAGLAEYVRPSR
jgi:hypothetical protein